MPPRLQDADLLPAAGHVIATSESKAFDHPGVCVRIPLVSQIRQGVTSIAGRLLEYRSNPGNFEGRQFTPSDAVTRARVYAD